MYVCVQERSHSHPSHSHPHTLTPHTPTLTLSPLTPSQATEALLYTEEEEIPSPSPTTHPPPSSSSPAPSLPAVSPLPKQQLPAVNPDDFKKWLYKDPQGEVQGGGRGGRVLGGSRDTCTPEAANFSLEK